MQTIKFVKDHNGYPKGSVLKVDENSAKSLIERELAEAYTEGGDGSADGLVSLASSSNMQVAQIVEADMPKAEPGEAPKRSDAKPELVKYAEGRLHGDDGQPLSVEEIEALTKAEIADKLGLE